ncbi:hypothetical protein DFP73DRAFT_586159 [Morchella snyderi]|nr:hypothetical protein DFP73DRAFT_586159 [Morchella snyderi]
MDKKPVSKQTKQETKRSRKEGLPQEGNKIPVLMALLQLRFACIIISPLNAQPRQMNETFLPLFRRGPTAILVVPTLIYFLIPGRPLPSNPFPAVVHTGRSGRKRNPVVEFEPPPVRLPEVSPVQLRQPEPISERSSISSSQSPIVRHIQPTCFDMYVCTYPYSYVPTRVNVLRAFTGKKGVGE